MIYIILKAQLGNQLFQIFNGISLSFEHNLDYRICIKNDSNTLFDNNITYFDNFLSELNNKSNISNEKILENNNNLYNEKHFHYDEIIISKENDIYINGFFQSDKYFKKHYDKINNLLNIDSKKIIVKNKYNKYFDKKTIAIHFRIGDYYYLQNFHQILNIDYYNKSLKKIDELIDDDIKDYNILFFCQKCDDDIVNKYINILKNTNDKYNFIKISNDIINYEQMLLISNCDNIIIANSTFSWFGAYFSNSNYILYPKKWFGPANKDKVLKDLFPENWIEII
jgi:hypothetical protein